jgi:Trypsin-like peptidase domain/Zinc finger, ZZ type
MEGTIHIWNHCHSCGAQPIVGIRFECQVCPAGPDNDLCELCYRQFLKGAVKHPRMRRGLNLPELQHRFLEFQGKLGSEYVPWLALSRSGLPAPPIPDHFLIRPEFQCGRQSFLGTYAFAATHRNESKQLLLTALHVLDDVAKSYSVDCSTSNFSYTGTELPAVITQVRLYDAFADNWVLAELGSADSMLVLPSARVGEPEPCSKQDIAGFRVDPHTSLNAAKIADRDPAVGEAVWLVANQFAKRSFEAIVVEPVKDSFIFRFRSTKALSKNTSGAPLVNSDGEIVGINVGAGFFEGHWFGHGNFATSIRSHLDSAPADR